LLRTIEAIIEPDGHVRLLEPITVPVARRALVTVLDESADPADLTALLSEPSLASDWTRPEEDAAWQHLQGAA
jgi:hypothetical protein